ncbi:MAG: arginine--tRNA ligase, partial [Patescibacteria group bacterium]|nr:arginine--tRNA ligase [Patescibacteria group bacterium]
IVENGLKKKIFKKDKDENVIAKFKKLPDRVVLRADGTAIYVTNDLAYVKKVFKENKVNKFVYVVGGEQELYFKQLFQIFKQLGFKYDVHHLNYGIVNLPEGRMKSREGTVVDADDLIMKMEDYATKEIKTRHDFLKQTNVEKRAEVIALAALKYFMLNVGPKNNMIYNPRASLSFTGNTGPYLLYTYARISNILKKARSSKKSKINFSKIESKTEHQIIVMLADFENILKKSLDNYDSSELTKYLYNLAKTFSDFYRDVRVIDAEKEIRETRLFFLNCVREVLGKGLGILGIESLEKM